MIHEIRIALIDDHEMVLQGLGALLDSQTGLKVIAKFKSGEDAAEQLEMNKVDVILTDINMPGFNGFETLSALIIKNPNSKIIMLSMETGSNYMRKAKEEGAKGFVSKTAPIEDLKEAILLVFQGNEYFTMGVD